MRNNKKWQYGNAGGSSISAEKWLPDGTFHLSVQLLLLLVSIGVLLGRLEYPGGEDGGPEEQGGPQRGQQQQQPQPRPQQAQALAGTCQDDQVLQ